MQINELCSFDCLKFTTIKLIKLELFLGLHFMKLIYIQEKVISKTGNFMY
jgi:hypothetical protein